MYKKFLKNISLILFLNILIKPFWVLGIDRAVQNLVGFESYGFYYAVFNFTFLFNILLDVGITNFNNRNIAQNNHLLRKHLSNILMLKMMLGVFYLVLSLIIAFVIQYTIQHIIFLLVLAFNQFLISLIMYLRSNLSGLHLFKIDSVVSVLDRTIMTVICAILLWGGLSIDFTIEIYMLVQTIGYLLTAIIALLIVFKKAKSRFLKLNWNRPFFVMIIKQSFPYAILILLMSFYNRIDTVLLERMLPDGAEQSGIYASSYRLLDATNMIAFLFAGMLLPMFSRMIKFKERVDELVKLAFTILIIPALLVAVSCFYYGHEIMQMLYPKHMEELIPAYNDRLNQSVEIFTFLMFCFVAISTTYIFGTLLTANGNLKELNLMATCGMAFNIILNIIFIPYYKAIGAAFISMITQFLTAIAQVIIAKRMFKFNVNYTYLKRLLMFILGVFVLGWILRNTTINWVISIAILSIVSIIWVFVIRLISVKSLFNIMKYGE